ncbi:4-aminobutyrate aminotransferase-like enzyme [Bradyrhizobium yuanmingense]
MSRLLRTGLNAGEAAPMAVVGGEGVYFHLADGRKLIDGSNTGGGLGHRHPAMVEAIRRAADTPVVNEGWTWVGREQAADDLMTTAFKGEEDWVGAVRFCISGSEANDMALSLCQALTQRSALATRERAYHGITGLSRSMTVQPQWHGGLAVHAGGSKLPAPMAPVRILPAPDGAIYGAPANNTPPSEYLADAPRLLSDTAATIIDYTQGGIYYDGAYQDEVARCARQAGSYWIADEVVTGAGPRGALVRVPGRAEPARYRDARKVARRRRGGRGRYRGVQRHRRAAEGHELAELRHAAWPSDQHGGRQRLSEGRQ